MAVRLRDIADDLNLSTMTISKVLRGQTDVSEETKARVLERVRELNYKPNVSARGLRTGQTYSAGMVVPSLTWSGASEIASGANEIFRPLRYSLMLSSADGDADGDDREVDFHLARQVDALLFCVREDASDIPLALKDTSTPVLLLGQRPERVSALSIGVDEFEVGYIAAKHLLDRRCRRIAYLRGGRTSVADLRFSGFLEAMRESGTTVRQEWVVAIPLSDRSYSNAVEVAHNLLMTRPRPDGIVCNNDFLATAVRDASAAVSLNIPEHLQLVGAGNQPSLCEAGLPLTSVDTKFCDVGQRAAKVALRLIEKKDRAAMRSVLLAPTIVQRESTRRKF